MNYSAYLKMNSQEIETEINKQRQKIKNINEQITLLKKLKVAAEVTEKTEKQKTDQIEKPENKQSVNPKVPVEQSSKSLNQHMTPQQPQQSKPTTNQTAGGLQNGAFRKIHG